MYPRVLLKSKVVAVLTGQFPNPLLAITVTTSSDFIRKYFPSFPYNTEEIFPVEEEIFINRLPYKYMDK